MQEPLLCHHDIPSEENGRQNRARQELGEETATEETSVQEELTDTRVVDIFAELNEEPVSEDAENDFEEK